MFPFDLPESLAINAARIDHLRSLGLNLENRTVLEPGCGIGHLTGFWEDRNCRVTSTELQLANIVENVSRHPGRERVLCRGVESGFGDLGRFDVVFCYGLLYHVRDPEQLLRHMAEVCDDLLLLETMVHPVDDGQIHLYPQVDGPDQGIGGPAYRPSRNWVMDKMGHLMGFQYVSVSQPNYPDFPASWPGTAPVCRSVFVGSRKALSLKTLSSTLIMQHEN